MHAMVGHVVALDFGATSGRVILGEVGPNQLRTATHARFTNRPVRVRGCLQWNVLSLWQGALDGLSSALREVPTVSSVATDTWGVDYGMLRGGELLGNPRHYRDERTSSIVGEVQSRASAASQYSTTGIQFMPINTIYQLAVDAADNRLELADTVLLMPDLFTYWLSGVRIAETTMASTTGMLNVHTQQWSDDLIAVAGARPGLFPDLVMPGTRIGKLDPDVARQVRAESPIEVVAVGSHDTASAVTAIPMQSESAAFISCGTWGLAGVELENAVVTDEARVGGFTNEVGVDGRILLMRNVMGLWILSEAVRQWEREGDTIGLPELIAAAAAVEKEMPVVDVDDSRFLAPGNMPERIVEWCGERGIRAPTTRAEMARCIIESLAQAFADAVLSAGSLSNVPVRTIHIVGGGSLNQLLCQRTADRSGIPVLAGPVEATALGSVLVQARAMGHISGGLDTLRDLVRRTHHPVSYSPR
ncbi:putative rhamnulokinase [marine actinobacterium PHSC20C1]|nr:putative rhamnulokinase [marine actinobacterium PHSC20C1]